VQCSYFTVLVHRILNFFLPLYAGQCRAVRQILIPTRISMRATGNKVSAKIKPRSSRAGPYTGRNFFLTSTPEHPSFHPFAEDPPCPTHIRIYHPLQSALTCSHTRPHNQPYPSPSPIGAKAPRDPRPGPFLKAPFLLHDFGD